MKSNLQPVPRIGFVYHSWLKSVKIVEFGYFIKQNVLHLTYIKTKKPLESL
jgi:hypothetical protein